MVSDLKPIKKSQKIPPSTRSGSPILTDRNQEFKPWMDRFTNKQYQRPIPTPDLLVFLPNDDLLFYIKTIQIIVQSAIRPKIILVPGSLLP